MYSTLEWFYQFGGSIKYNIIIIIIIIIGIIIRL